MNQRLKLFCGFVIEGGKWVWGRGRMEEAEVRDGWNRCVLTVLCWTGI